MFTFAMVTFPIGSYFLTVNKLYGGKYLILVLLPTHFITSSSHLPNMLDHQLLNLTILHTFPFIVSRLKFRPPNNSSKATQPTPAPPPPSSPTSSCSPT